MYSRIVAFRAPLVGAILFMASAAAAVDLQIVSRTPLRNSMAPVGTSISIEFDRPLNPATITASSFRVFGRGSGTKTGAFTFSNGNRTVTLTPTQPFSAGEIVLVNLSHDIAAADATPARSAGYAYQFVAATQPSARIFHDVATMSNRSSPGVPTRIYGALAVDFNNDSYLDLGTVNEDSGDVRVFLNRADGSGLYEGFLPPVPIGLEASPNEPADFNNDGKADACISATSSGSVWVLLGDGNGAFSSVTGIPTGLGSDPHGIAVLDVDGDGDLDIVNANHGYDNLSLLLNNGSGSFAAPVGFDSGANGEYGLAAGDVNNDDITDLVVGARDGQEIRALLGNGDGTFTAAAGQSSGGETWVVVLGDVNSDGNLDVSAANSVSGNGAILLGAGDGTFGAPALTVNGAHNPSTDLGDMDGDGDLDWILSSFGGQYWRLYVNDGMGNFSFDQQFDAVSNPSCAILYDSDNDGDLDLALSDEIADVLVLMENEDTSLCSPMPLACRTPFGVDKSTLTIKNRADDTRDALSWSWTKGAMTTKMEFGNPLTTDNYELCLYQNGALENGFRAPAGGQCGTKDCWSDARAGYSYRDGARTPDGVKILKLKEGLENGKANIRVGGKGAALDLPDLTQLTGTLQVQLQRSGSTTCWGATFVPPFLKNDGETLRAKGN